ncbi:PqqD family protein [Microbacterium sp. SLBN-111]|uniref:PqqD family protein n=1 Tax=Microbacterium sp. SLBN-111 TaxID=3377733 RepID=UPI003C707917
MIGPADPRLGLSSNVVWTELDGVVFVANAAAPEPFVVRALEGTAATIWQLLQDGPTEQILISRIASEYGVDAIDVTAEVRRFLGELRVSGLLADDR